LGFIRPLRAFCGAVLPSSISDLQSPGSRRLPILMYHSVGVTSSDTYRRWVVTPDRFARHVDFLAGHNYQPILVSTLASLIASRAALPPRPVVITFDDGLRDFLTGAMPILQRHSFFATLFVVTGYVGSTSRWLHPLGEGMRRMLSWKELREVSACGIECGAHTNSHRQLDILPPADAFEEILSSKSILEDRLGRPVEAFAYPHGYASRATRELVREAGFTSACRVRHALSSTGEDLFALSRIVMTNDMDENDLAQLLGGVGLPVAPARERLAATGWRFVRRFRNWGQVSIDPALRPPM